MRWLRHEVVSGPDPRVVLPLAEVRAFLGLRKAEKEPDPQLDSFRLAAVALAERRIRGAVYPQVRRYTALFGEASDAPLLYNFEPFGDPPSPVVLYNGAARSFSSIGGQIIRLDERLDPQDGDTLSFQLSVGLSDVPESLRAEMLIEVQRMLERFRQIETGNEAPVLVPRQQTFQAYSNDPLNPYAVEVGDGLP